MKRNWYAVYTKVNCEKKVAALLSKKEIRNYYPLNRVVNFGDKSKKNVYEPLIPTIVFVYIRDAEMASVKSMNGVVNFVYWLGKPVVIKNDEIVNMQFFTAEYSNVKLEKITLNPDGTSSVPAEPDIDINEKLVSVRNAIVKLLLPSLGFMMVAEGEKSRISIFNNNIERNKLAV